ncbi:MAG: hypothetical protein JNJ60_15455 [Rhodocyclaceae bacterium]|nr:hypothetical protein [Rhodocyclaceae bacterium]
MHGTQNEQGIQEHLPDAPTLEWQAPRVVWHDARDAEDGSTVVSADTSTGGS